MGVGGGINGPCKFQITYPFSGIDKEKRQVELNSDFVGATEIASAITICQSVVEDIQSCNRLVNLMNNK